MAFQGDLSNINLASVFQNLLQNEQTGTLRLYDGARERYVYFREGRISMFSSGKEVHTPVGEFLVRRGDLTEAQLVTAKKRRRGRRNLTSVLGRMGIEEKKIQDAVRNFVEEEVCDVFTWDHGRFEFTEGAPIKGVFDSDATDVKLELASDRIILEAARRTDEWDRINRQLRSTSEIFVLRKERSGEVGEKFDKTTAEVSGLFDGRRDVEAVIADSGMGRFHVSRAVAALLEAGFVRPVSLTEVIGQAENALQGSEWATAIRCFRRALEMERNNIECRRGLAQALEGIGEKGEALAERKLLSNTLADMGRKAEAAEEIRHAIEDVPTDITARERYVSLLTEAGETRPAESAKLELGKTYLELGIAEKASRVFSEVLEAKPKEPASVALMLAGACIKAGNVPGAVEAYSQAGDFFLKTEDLEKAGGVYSEILKVQPGNTDAKRKLDDIISGKLLRRKRRWRLVKYACVAVILVLIGIGWLVYDFKARRILHECSLEALDLVEEGEIRKAIACYERAREGYPLTYAAGEAGAARDHLRERLALRLMAEAKRLEKRNRKSAEAKYREASEISPVPATRDRAQEAIERLGGKKAAPDAPGP